MPAAVDHDTLPIGSRLGEFEILQVLGIGGFGIVYLAMDHALERQVAIKEYMPGALAVRDAEHRVTLRSQAHAETYALGLKSFINEARLLARFDHPALVKVYRFWEEQGTAYMVMPYYKGRTLQQARREMSAPPDENWLRQLVNPLLGALDLLHREHIYHRDIAPDNIMLLEHDRGDWPCPVLLDLGAARRVIGDQTQALTAILKPSFAPIEQYAETVQLRQGAWTDLYALAAVVHFCITGRPPVPASARAVHDDMPMLAQLREGLNSGFGCSFSDSFVLAIDHALAVRPQDRPESVAAWRQELSGIVVSAQAEAQSSPAVQPTILVRPESGERPEGHVAIEAAAYMTTVPAHRVPTPDSERPAHAPMPVTIPIPDPTAPVEAPSSSQDALAADSVATAGQSGRTWWRGALVATCVVLALAGWWKHRHAAEAAPVGEASAVASAASTAVAASTPAPKASVAKASSKASQASAVASAATRQPLNPRLACGDRTFISLAICMKRHCSRPEYEGHAECKRMRDMEDANRNRSY
ncbi:serine/threonine protein kinase [Aquabacterium sp.]|uniref:serine/threonine protein kinase n=1 Tax=Aquabacterium sp. TaxID=1872578 RepID=UPI0035B4366C